MQEKREISISTNTIIKIIFVLFLLWFVYLIRDILGMFFVAFVFASALDPSIDALERKKIPRAISIVMLYLVLFGVFSLAIGLIIPPIVEEFRQIAQSIPSYYDRFSVLYESFQEFSNRYGDGKAAQESLNSLSGWVGRLSGNVLSASSRLFGGLFSLLAVLVMTFYLTIGETGMKAFFRSVVPSAYQPYCARKINEIQSNMGQWLRGQLMLSLIIFCVIFLSLLALDVQYALVLALIAGLAEFIPVIGPIISAVPAVFLTFVDSPFKALLVVILYIMVQQIENQILVPKVMQKSVGLNPLIILLSMLIGARLVGVLGILLAIPTVTIIKIFVKDFFEDRKQQEQKLET